MFSICRRTRNAADMVADFGARGISGKVSIAKKPICKNSAISVCVCVCLSLCVCGCMRVCMFVFMRLAVRMEGRTARLMEG